MQPGTKTPADAVRQGVATAKVFKDGVVTAVKEAQPSELPADTRVPMAADGQV